MSRVAKILFQAWKMMVSVIVALENEETKVPDEFQNEC